MIHIYNFCFVSSYPYVVLLWCIVSNHCSLMILHEAGCLYKLKRINLLLLIVMLYGKIKMFINIWYIDVKPFCNLGRREQKLAVSWILEE